MKYNTYCWVLIFERTKWHLSHVNNPMIEMRHAHINWYRKYSVALVEFMVFVICQNKHNKFIMLWWLDMHNVKSRIHMTNTWSRNKVFQIRWIPGRRNVFFLENNVLGIFFRIYSFKYMVFNVLFVCILLLICLISVIKNSFQYSSYIAAPSFWVESLK